MDNKLTAVSFFFVFCLFCSYALLIFHNFLNHFSFSRWERMCLRTDTLSRERDSEISYHPIKCWRRILVYTRDPSSTSLSSSRPLDDFQDWSSSLTRTVRMVGHRRGASSSSSRGPGGGSSYWSLRQGILLAPYFLLLLHLLLVAPTLTRAQGKTTYRNLYLVRCLVLHCTYRCLVHCAVPATRA